jgi:Aspartyl protease
MRHFIASSVSLLGLLILRGSGALLAQTPDELHRMFVANQVFALRDAVAHGDAPLLYRGAVEASLNQIGPAQKDLGKIVQTDPHSKDAYDARDLLGNLYFRNGLYREALAEIEAEHVEKPDAADVNNALPLFRALSESPDMRVVRREGSRFLRSGDGDGSFSLPVKIDGKDVTYGFDTGSSISVIGTSDAKLLGLTIKSVGTKLSESSGTDISGVSIAVAKDLMIGGLHLQNVAFFVLQDTEEPFVSVPVGSRGLIGLPVLIAMQALRWERTGWFELGPKARHQAAPAQNMLFHDSNPVVQVGVKEKLLSMSLDTGAMDTDLNEGFAKAFPELVAAGEKENRAITGFGGSNKYDSVLLGPVVFRVGGTSVTLKAPHVFVSHSLGKWDGNLGNDILDQASGVTLDFRAMALALE